MICSINIFILLFLYLYLGLSLNGKLERIIIVLAVVSFAFTSVCLLIIREVPLTIEEAIEISKGSSLVKEGLAITHSTSVEAHYYNSQRIEQLREWHQEEIFKNVPKDEFWEEKVPKGHSVWEIIWYFHKGVGGYSIIVIVDAEVGRIITEEKGIKFL